MALLYFLIQIHPDGVVAKYNLMSGLKWNSITLFSQSIHTLVP